MYKFLRSIRHSKDAGRYATGIYKKADDRTRLYIEEMCDPESPIYVKENAESLKDQVELHIIQKELEISKNDLRKIKEEISYRSEALQELAKKEEELTKRVSAMNEEISAYNRELNKKSLSDSHGFYKCMDAITDNVPEEVSLSIHKI